MVETGVFIHTSWEEQGRLYQQFELCAGSLQELAERENNIPERLIWGYLVDLLQVPLPQRLHGTLYQPYKRIPLGNAKCCLHRISPENF
jgi:hypothetical protein